MRVVAAIIAHNAEGKIGELLSSLKGHVDAVVVGIDPKTTDKTAKIASEHGVDLLYDGLDVLAIPEDTSRQWGFSAARQLSFEKARSLDATHVLWIDTDDVLQSDPGVTLFDVVRENEDASLIWLDYAYHRDEYENVTTLFQRERVINLAFNPKWVGALHETCTVGGKGRMHRDRRVWVLHKNRSEEGKNGRNFKMLEHMVKDPNDHRAVLYLAHQHFAAQNWYEAAEWYAKYTDLRSEGTPAEEKWQAHIYRSKALRLCGRLEDSIQAANNALLLRPQYADAYYELSNTYTQAGSHKKAVFWHELGRDKEQPDTILIQNPLDYYYNPFVTVHPSYAELGNLDKAIECVNQALDWRPRESALLAAKEFYEWARDRDHSIAGGLKLVEHLLDHNEPEKAQKVLDTFPAGSESDSIAKARSQVKDALYYLGNETEYDLFYIQQDVKSGPQEWAVSRMKGLPKILDVGVGDGSTVLSLAKDGQAIGIDIDPKRVKEGNFAAAEAGFLQMAPAPDYSDEEPIMLPVMAPEAKAQFHYGDIRSLPKKFTDQRFDAVHIGSLLARVPDPMKALDNVEAIADRVLLSIPNGAHPKNKSNVGIVRTWSQSEMENILWQRGALVESRRIGDDESTLVFEYLPKKEVLDKPPVVIFCGKGWEPWTPDSIDNGGLGGSETAVVLLAKELAKKGLRVMVYAEAHGIWDGVFYRHWTKFDPNRPVFAFIAWRMPEAFDWPIQAEQKFLWMHDTDAGPRLTEERAKKIDSVWCLSEWHKNHLAQAYPFIADRLTIIGNGIDPLRFAHESERARGKVIYASSPDRGLEQALTYWPKVRERVPDAELHVFYGWNTYEKMRVDPFYKARIMDMVSPGVVWRGRVGQNELAQEMAGASALFYPGPHPFCETFCIAVLEAQAAGCVPVTRDNGALPETNRYGIKLANLSEDEKWVDALVLAMGRSEEQRAKMREWALTQTWEAVAKRVVDDVVATNKRRSVGTPATDKT